MLDVAAHLSNWLKALTGLYVVTVVSDCGSRDVCRFEQQCLPNLQTYLQPVRASHTSWTLSEVH